VVQVSIGAKLSYYYLFLYFGRVGVERRGKCRGEKEEEYVVDEKKIEYKNKINEKSDD